MTAMIPAAKAIFVNVFALLSMRFLPELAAVERLGNSRRAEFACFVFSICEFR